MRSRILWAVLAAALLFGCGGGSTPTAPAPTPAPTVSSVTIIRTTPASGATLLYKTEEVYVQVGYTVSAADRAAAEVAGEVLVISVCMSVDGMAPTGPCFYQAASEATGETFHHTGVSSLTPVPRTDYVLAFLIARHGSGQAMVERKLQKCVTETTYFWK